MKKWITSTSEEWFSGCEEYGSKEEAIKSAANDHGLEDGDKFYVGTKEDFILSPTDSEDLIDSLICNMDEKSGEWSESWEAIVSKCPETRSFAQKKINEICDYINKNHPATFFTVENVTEERVSL